MFNHEPKEYICPFCAILGGREDERNTKQDIVYQNKFATAFIAPKWWANNAGHVLVIANKHYENMYSIPDKQLAEAYKVVKKIAIAIRSVYGCEGISTRQHNEPAGNQDVWHFHIHVYPRYNEDRLYHNHDQKDWVDAKARAPYAQKLRTYLAKHTD